MSMTEAPFSYTLKTPKGGNLLTIRGDGAEDFKANLEQLPVKGILALISEIENTLAGQPKESGASRPAAAKAAETPANPTVTSTAVAPSSPASTGDQQLPAGMGNPACDTCGGETRFDKEGISQKSGKPYSRYLCAANNLHRATFA